MKLKYQYFDTHSHTNMPPLLDNADAIFANCAEKKIFLCVVGVDHASNKIAIEQSKKYPNAICQIGIHPCEIVENWKQQVNEFEVLVANNVLDIKAVGEIGLDYYHKKTESKIQINVFKQCLEIAIKYNKPVVLHIRDAYQDAYDVLSEYHARLSKILIHCYDGDAEWVSKFSKLNCYFAVGGKVTYENGAFLRDAIKTIANNRLVLETDCPFLCPMPNKKDINTPENIIIIHDYVTEILQKDITEQVVINACTFYDIEINEI